MIYRKPPLVFIGTWLTMPGIQNSMLQLTIRIVQGKFRLDRLSQVVSKNISYKTF